MALDLSPAELVNHLSAMPTATTASDLLGPHVLLIDVGAKPSEVHDGLMASSPFSDGALIAPGDGLGFATSATIRLPSSASQFTGVPVASTILSLLTRLSNSAYFICPFRKRESPTPGLTERFNVGRARNNDIVLRHSSVSKLHAFFQRDSKGTLFVTDVGSTNLTRVNGAPIAASTAVPLETGTELRFGQVSGLLCDTRVLHALIEQQGNKAK